MRSVEAGAARVGFLEMVVGGGFDLEDYLNALPPVPCPCIAFTVLKLTP